MGGRKVFIQLTEDEDLWALIKDADDYFNHWFVKIREWSPTEVSVERVAWIRIYGIPAHVWKEDFFKMIVESFGELLMLDDDTSHRRRFDFARVLIKTSSSYFINQLEKVKIDNNFFVLRFLEELEYNQGVRARSKIQVKEISEDEESNSHLWYGQQEEDDDRDANSQNMEREYNNFNEAWEREASRGLGGADTELLEYPRLNHNKGGSGNSDNYEKISNQSEGGTRKTYEDMHQETNSYNLSKAILGQDVRPNTWETSLDPICNSKAHDPLQDSRNQDLSVEELSSCDQRKTVLLDISKTNSVFAIPTEDDRIDVSLAADARIGAKTHKLFIHQSKKATEKEERESIRNRVGARRRRRVIPKLKHLARIKHRKMKNKKKQRRNDKKTMEE
ncbi:DUF4283 domain protein, partial [Trifolium medium]|nr:DUF4283 domain protein [Trifolium medium]